MLLNTDTILKKYEKNRVNYINDNHKRTFTQTHNSLSTNNFFFKNKNEIEKKRSNLHLLSVNLKDHSTSEKTLTFLTNNNNNNNNNKFFHSRNNSNYNTPVKLLSYDNNNNNNYNNNNINYIYKKSTFHSSNRLKVIKLNLNHEKRNSMDDIIENSKNNDDDRKNKKLKSEKTVFQSSKNLSLKEYFNLKNEFEMNYQNDYKPILKKKKSRESRKKTKYNKQLSKISESESGTNKSFSTNQIYMLTKSSNDIINSDLEKEKKIQRKSYDLHRSIRKENSSKFNLSKFCKIDKNDFENKNENEIKPYLIIQDDLQDINNENKYHNAINNINIKSNNKINDFLQFFEDDIQEELNIIVERNFHSKNYLFENLMEDYSKNYLTKKLNYLKEIQSHLLIQSNIDRKNDLQKTKLNYKFVNHLILKYSKKKHINYDYYDISLLSTEFLFNKYFELSLSNKFFKEKYFDFEYDKKRSSITLINNFKIEKKEKKKKSYKQLYNPKRKNNSVILSMPLLHYLSKENYYYIIYFYQIDYEYYILPHASSIKITDVKLKIKNEALDIKKTPNLIIKNKSFLKRISKQYSVLNDSPTFEKRKDKQFLKNALKKNNFFKRKKTIHSKDEIFRKKSSKIQLFKLQKERIIEKRHYQNEGYNKLRMISRANDLKQEMLNQLNSRKEKIIFYVKDRNYPGFVSTFEKYKVSPDMEDSNGVSLLSIAVQSNSFQIVNYLLNVGANPNIRDNNNNTPLHFALTFHNYEIADMLIQRGADEKVINKMGITPWECLDSAHSII